MTKKGKKILLIFLGCSFFLCGIYGAICRVCEGLLPERRTLYLSYSSFCRDAKYAVFMEELPESASGKKYFHQICLFTFKNGYRIQVGKEEYEETKKKCLEEKEEYIADFVESVHINGKLVRVSEEEEIRQREALDLYNMNDNGTEESSVEKILEENNVGFFNELASQDVKEGNYHFLWYWREDDPEKIRFRCSIYNDETREIIEICYTVIKILEW